MLAHSGRGLYGARGIKGHEAVARQLDAFASYITTPATARAACSPAPTRPA
ncbi:hypothetical protein [Streptomyces sp. NPDC001275]